MNGNRIIFCGINHTQCIINSKKWIINITYNLIFAEKFENINKLFSINNKENIEQIKNKIRMEIRNGLSKDKILKVEDKRLIYQFYLKIKNEFEEIEKN